MEGALVAVKVQQKKVELSLICQRGETTRLLAALVQTEEDLNKEKLHWEEENKHPAGH